MPEVSPSKLEESGRFGVQFAKFCGKYFTDIGQEVNFSLPDFPHTGA
jgi:hypothetical protein